ncbi:MAG TPA: SpoIIE family protein phosphatase [Vicinamibacterales bacterium]|nr:SpoIIE family protein phosphatase [Vicinamibacterales bacterium]
MSTPRLEVRDVLGERVVSMDRLPFTIGRRETNDLRLGGSEVSREHAEIANEAGKFVLRDKASRYGTFVNGEPASECELRPGDRIRLGRGGGADLLFLAGDEDRSLNSRSTTGARDDLRQITALLEGFRALGSGRVLQEVLELVLDAAIEISGAERAFIMLAGADGKLEFKLARGRAKQPLTDSTFKISQKIPEEVFKVGRTKALADLLDGGLADAHMGTVALGIRNVVCVPLNFVRYVESNEARGDDQRIGVLYLDSREKGTLLSETTRGALETLAAEASVAIENARLYRDKLEKAKLEREMQIAAEIQQSLLPKPRVSLGFVEAYAASIPCRSIGGDFFDYIHEPGSVFGFTLGDVAGKGPPAALMSALMQGMFAAQAQYADGPASAVTHMNKALCRRGLESRFVTLMFGIIKDGRLTYCNAGHNPPFVLGKSGVRRLEDGGPVVGLLEFAPFSQGTITLDPGDLIIVFSDGVSEALNAAGEEFGDARLEEVASAMKDSSSADIVERIVAAVKLFTKGAPQSDDITAMAIRYLGPGA